MKVGICSDIHENFNNLELVLKRMKEESVDKIICLGDYCCPLIIKKLAEFEIPSIGILGNNDHEIAKFMKISLSEKSKFEFIDETFYELLIDGKSFFVTHYPKIAELAFKSKEYDVVCYGHDHVALIDDEENDDTSQLLINPGEVAGHKTGKVSFAIYDTEKNYADIIYIDNNKTVITNKSSLDQH